MPSMVFWFLAFLLLGFAVGVVAFRNPVSSALSLVGVMLALAAMMIHAGAFFLGAVQALVYAGAVMTLFIFIVMLLNLKEETGAHIGWAALVGGVSAASAFAWIVYKSVSLMPPLWLARVVRGDAQALGKRLFTHYQLPFEITAILLLVAIVGVVMLSSRLTIHEENERKMEAGGCSSANGNKEGGTC